jgi:hypothetical protein
LFFVGLGMVVAAVMAMLGGCASGNSPEQDTLAALIAGKHHASPPIPAEPDLRYRYLRVEVQGYPPALLVLGYIDPHPTGAIEVWYSAQREVIKTQNGRVVATAGLPIDWTAVRFVSTPPPWDQVPQQSLQFQRSRDEMPGYRYGIVEQVQWVPVSGVPAIPLVATLPMATANTYQWFQESVKATQGGAALPDAWFAWGKHRGDWTVVYSHQCLTADFCLRLQRWPVREGVQ